MENRMEELERELKETGEQLALTREQLRLQSRRARQLVAACSTKVEEKEREMRMLRALKDGQLQSIVRKLLHFESLLRQEQKRVVEIVRQKDQIIWNQSSELEQLRQTNRKLLMAANQDPDDNLDASNPAASKMAKLDPENKENLIATEKQQQQQHLETPLVTKMVRRFEPVPAGGQKKPQVPKKPARLLAPTTATVANLLSNQQQQPSGGTKGVVRTDSVNDHGYFTLEKRKPVRMSVTPTPVQVTETNQQSPTTPRDPPTADRVADEMDLRHNFEEFHLMDSLEEEEQQQHMFQPHSETPPRTPDRSSGDGAEWNSSGGSLQLTPPHNGLADCTSLSITAGSVQILPQLGDATPTSGVQFDRFLDASGLTQKSILTPSRLLSNHKNMLKPKDVKHRHMINKAAQNAPNTSVLMGFNCRSSESILLSAGDPARLHHHHHGTNQVRYYVEPFL